MRHLRLVQIINGHCAAQSRNLGDLALAIKVSRQRLSRILNLRSKPTMDEVQDLADVLKLQGEDARLFELIGRDAQTAGWWQRIREKIGPRQALAADLECGATELFEYHLTIPPGLLQTPEYAAARAATDTAEWPKGFDPAMAVDARRRRQRAVLRPGGPGYQVVIDELALRRLSAPWQVTCEQLRHIATVARTPNRVLVRVLPIDAEINSNRVPKSAFSLYRHESGDPEIGVADTVTSDVMITDPAEVTSYHVLHAALSDAALGTHDSIAFLHDLANHISHRNR
ncbi:transcriptional regulator with XRE-family HTH domain [Longispora fulva]|uniref:Transcriptional regulator with XRE-family HTH domain n=1 Tax=Longispora fulva TaxID=619741 RepID=A0A8J7KMG1_9ACTN|nr:transcriptional regulator with XRE-family HTH domain [Longispora fulva]